MDKIKSCCKICKYTITNKLTTILHHKISYTKHRNLLVSCTIPIHKASCTQSSCSQPHVTVQLHFILFFALRL